MLREITFSHSRWPRSVGHDVEFGRAHALDVQLLGFAELTAVLALRRRAALFLDLIQRAVGVLTRGRAVTFDTRLATSQ